MANDDLTLRFGSDTTGVEQGSRRAASTLGAIEKAAEKIQSAFKQLKGSVDPLWAAQERYNVTLDAAKALLDSGQITQERYRQILDQTTIDYDRIVQAIGERKRAEDSSIAAVRQSIQQAEQSSRAATEEANAKRQAADVARSAANDARIEVSAKQQIAREARVAIGTAREEAREKRHLATVTAQEAREAERASQEKNAAVVAAGNAVREATGRERQARLQAAQAALEEAQAARQNAVEKREAANAAAVVAQAAHEEIEARRQSALASSADVEIAKQTAREKTQAAQQAADAANAAARDELTAKRALANETKKLGQIEEDVAQERAKAERTAANEIKAVYRDLNGQLQQVITTEEALNRERDQVLGSINPVVAAQNRYNTELEKLNRLLALGKLQQHEYNQAIREAQRVRDLDTRGLGRQNQAYIQLGYQVQDVVASVASGINPFVILAQQGGQTAAAISGMGGKLSGVAAIMQGPWGAAIIAGVSLLGMLIPKLFGAGEASEELKRRQQELANELDETTGKIKNQITWLQMLEGAKTAAKEGKDLEEEAEDTRREFVSRTRSTARPTVVTDPSTGNSVNMPSILSPKAKALVERTMNEVENEVTSVETAIKRLQAAAKSDSTLKVFISRLEDLGIKAGNAESKLKTNRIEMARLAIAMGTATDAQRKMVAQAIKMEPVSDAELNARARLRVATDGVQKAEAQLTIIRERAERQKKLDIATGMDRAKAEERYVVTVAKAEKAVNAAREANSAAGGSALTYLNAQAKLAVATNDVQRAEAQLVITKKEANDQRKADIAGGMSLADANRRYTATVKEAQSALNAARQAAKDKRAEDREGLREQKEEQQFLLEQLDFKKEMANEDLRKVLEIQDEKLAKLKEFFGEESKEYQRGLQEKARLERQHTQQLVQIERERIQLLRQVKENAMASQRDSQSINLDVQLDAVDLGQETGALNRGEAIAERRRILQEQLDLERRHEQSVYELRVQSLQDELNLQNLRPEDRRRILGQLELAESEHQNNLTRMTAQHAQARSKLENTIARESVQRWKNILNPIGQAWNQMFNQIWMRSASFKDMMLQFGDSIVFAMMNAATQSVVNWAAAELAKTSATQAGVATRTATEAQGTGIIGGILRLLGITQQTTEAVRTGAVVGGSAARTAADVGAAAASTAATTGAAGVNVVAHGAEAAAGAAAATAQIPVVGPAIAPGVAAAILAMVLGFGAMIASARGGWGRVPEDGMMTELHKDEMVLPAWIANPLRQRLQAAGPRSSPDLATVAAHAGSVVRTDARQTNESTFNYQPQVAIQDITLDDLLRREGDRMRRWVKNEMRNNGNMLRPKR